MKDYQYIRILVADDTEPVRSSVISILREMGFSNISEAKDGVEALAELKRKRYDLLLCDRNMPKLDGMSLIRIMRSDVDLKDVVIFMLTADTEKGHVIEAKALGVNDYIVKPFTADIVTSKIEGVFGKRRESRGPLS
jgi:two-component system chemotaxis response regulator CheY